ncbi:MAG: MBL fold metallo-hydrolase [Actinobacteria bacterium]|nr:MBL fold metallo-hydrolase [Actinomycetota bacterium]
MTDERDRFVTGVSLGRWQTNCYVIGDRGRAAAFVVDPGENGATEVPRVLDEHGATCEAILLTHGHLDHLWAVPALAEELDVPVFLHPGDRWLWDDPFSGFGMDISPDDAAQFLGAPWQPPTERVQDLSDDQRLTFAGIEIRANHTPGHTPGHVTFLAAGLSGAQVHLDEPVDVARSGILVSGDLLFRGSVGRTDFPRGSWEEQMESLARVVVPLDDGVVLPGHGPATTVERERDSNPFLAEVVSGR